MVTFLNFSTYNLGKKHPTDGLGELVYSMVYSFLNKCFYASLIAYRVRTTHSKIVNSCIVQSIHVLTYVARHLPLPRGRAGPESGALVNRRRPACKAPTAFLFFY